MPPRETRGSSERSNIGREAGVDLRRKSPRSRFSSRERKARRRRKPIRPPPLVRTGSNREPARRADESFEPRRGGGGGGRRRVFAGRNRPRHTPFESRAG